MKKETPEVRFKRLVTGLNEAKVQMGVIKQNLKIAEDELRKLGIEPKDAKAKVTELEAKQKLIQVKLEKKLDEAEQLLREIRKVEEQS